MYYLIIFIISFILFNYNILSIWFSFFLELSCYISPFFWENQFFYCNKKIDFIYENVNCFNSIVLLENLPYFFYNKDYLYYLTFHTNKLDLEKNFHFLEDSKDYDNYYLMWLEATSTRSNLIDFYCLQTQQILLAGETSLSFYRILNKTNENILFYSVYIINPPNLTLFLVKVQCFCFEEILINAGELINLPILVYLDHSILLENKSNWINIIYLEYIALIKEI